MHGCLRRLTGLLVILLAVAPLVGCGRPPAPSPADSATGPAAVSPSPDAWLAIDEETTADERRYLEAAKPFVLAIAARDYAAAHALLSTHARARMSVNQFDPPEDDAAFARNEQVPVPAVSAAGFAQLMARVEARYGLPRRPLELHVFETDPGVLSGQRAKRPQEPADRLDVMFAIGNMPESIPANIRRASLRGQLATELQPEDLARVAKEEGVAPDDLTSDPDFQPYFNLKLVLVEEAGRLLVGYFEFLPPSMLD